MTVTRTWLSRNEVREVDRRAIEEYGLPGVVLMENAGRGCVELLLDSSSLCSGSLVIACCGKGNNGGDGFVIARHLENEGIRVEVILACDPAELRGDAAVHFRVIDRADVPVAVAATPEQWHELAGRLSRAEWIVDALLGTGSEGSPREPIASARDECLRASDPRSRHSIGTRCRHGSGVRRVHPGRQDNDVCRLKARV
jgi:NAD(P)H-hydrate epimerase